MYHTNYAEHYIRKHIIQNKLASVLQNSLLHPSCNMKPSFPSQISGDTKRITCNHVRTY